MINYQVVKQEETDSNNDKGVPFHPLTLTAQLNVRKPENVFKWKETEVIWMAGNLA